MFKIDEKTLKSIENWVKSARNRSKIVEKHRKLGENQTRIRIKN